MKKKYSLNQIGLYSNNISNIKSRDDIHVHSVFNGKTVCPILNSPMKDVCSNELVGSLLYKQCLYVNHRFQPVKESDIYMNSTYVTSENKDRVIQSIGISDDSMTRFHMLYSLGYRNFCVDVANSSSQNVIDFVEKMIAHYKEIKIIVGNCMTPKGIDIWEKYDEVVGIRLSVGTGSACTTTKVTGMQYPNASLIIESRARTNKLLIADGGIKTPGDFCKAIALGADFVMLGSLFAQCKDSGAKKVGWFKKYKEYSGSASYATQKTYKQVPKYIEGQTIKLPASNKTSGELITSLIEGLKSSMSYANATSISDYRRNVGIVVL